MSWYCRQSGDQGLSREAGVLVKIVSVLVSIYNFLPVSLLRAEDKGRQRAS